MPIVSKYAVEQQEKLLNDVLETLQNEETPVDLALMTLGNAVTHIIAEHYSPQQAQQVAEQFGKVLLQSLGKSA
ncbi:DUF1414 domain-containing protein [Pseudidiomarina halophila]|uniref:Uncharacterized protein n=1 Tax=Pseudidiomarina halophila TaxID=1449799 RepID=A0A432Y0P0_9GAMM|nr:DUF1414 domain-containing protein [Pseudidiomarina halophila]RUO54506.1 hypothetical protein CWI69_03610 [Pseudidiomarina halophila]